MNDKVIPIKPISTWSFSRLEKFEKCRYYAKLLYIDKIPEPERPLPPGKLEHANDRGTRIHESAELFVRDKGPFIPEMRHFEPEFTALKRLFKDGKVSLEGDWGTDRNWDAVEWRSPDIWQRLKLDACVHLNPQEAVIIDYKSGKRFGNEIKHNEQTQLYAINTFLRYPKLEEVTTELWYLDIDELVSMQYLRHQALRFRPRWDSRANTMTTALEFKPNPNIYSCKWCPFKPVEKGGTGHCEKGV